MKTIQIRTARPYEVRIGDHLLDTIGLQMRQLTKAQKICIVSDTNVFGLYGMPIINDLVKEDFEVSQFVFPAGESSKNHQVYVDLLQHLAISQLTRYDCILALGGGVVGDLAGFAAATYLRGIDYVQVPTSLLAMVDSSVGGKTGIDLPQGKNLCGAFWQPLAVFCDTCVLQSLSQPEWINGCAEIIKYGILFSPDMINQLEQDGFAFHRQDIIAECVNCKKYAVEQDETDHGQRMLLNLGHTLGHAIEAVSNYTIPHGYAVSIGVAMIAKASHCPDYSRIVALLDQFGLPTTTRFCPHQLYSKVISDKKRVDDTISFIIPNTIGNCQVHPVAIADLITFISEVLKILELSWRRMTDLICNFR